MLKHYRGNKNKYSYNLETPTEAHKDGIYFAKDTHEILVNGQSYSGTTHEDIIISGGPLASEFTDESNTTSGSNVPNTWRTTVNGKASFKIPEGTDLQTILRTLFCSETWSIPSVTHGKLSPSLSDSTIPSWPSSTTLKEVGDTISIGTCTPGSINSNATQSSIGDFSNGGYYESEADALAGKNKKTTKPSNKSLTNVSLVHKVNADNEELDWERKIETDATNLNDVVWADNDTISEELRNSKKRNSTAAPNASTAPSVPGFSFKVKKGENKVICTQTVTNTRYTGTIPAWQSYWVISSLGKTNKDKKTTPHSETVSHWDVPGSKKTAPTFQGVYPIYTTGYLCGIHTTQDDTNKYKEAMAEHPHEAFYKDSNNNILPQKLTLNSVVNGSGNFFMYIGFGPDQDADGKQLYNKVILLPEGWKLLATKETNGVFVEGSSAPHPTDQNKWTCAVKSMQILPNAYKTGDQLFNTSYIQPLVNMESANVTGSTLTVKEGDNKYFYITSSNGHESKYTAWLLYDQFTAEALKVTVTKDS